MGVYYEVVNFDKKERIDLCDVTNIKHHAFSSWSLQIAIMNTFLGFGWPGRSVHMPDWIGRWSGDRIDIQNDAEDNDEEIDSWPDVGMRFLFDLKINGQLDNFIRAADLKDHWEVSNGLVGLQEWHKEQIEEKS